MVHPDARGGVRRVPAGPCAGASLSSFPWCDTSKSFVARATLLAAAMTPAEQLTQLSTFSFTTNHSGMNPGVPRLRLPQYNYHTEGLHGVRDKIGRAHV